MLSIARRLRSEVSTDSGHEVTPRRGEQLVDQMVTSFALNIAAREPQLGAPFPGIDVYPPAKGGEFSYRPARC